MPPVEALGFGLPVITTRCTALPESTRGLAHYVDDPLDAHELADALAAVLDDPQGKRPPPAALAGLRSSYAPAAIGAQYYGLLAGSGLSRPASAEYAYAQGASLPAADGCSGYRFCALERFARLCGDCGSGLACPYAGACQGV
jgi:hypothetical protein